MVSMAVGGLKESILSRVSNIVEPRLGYRDKADVFRGSRITGSFLHRVGMMRRRFTGILALWHRFGLQRVLGVCALPW